MINWGLSHKLVNYIVGNGQRAVPEKCGNYTERQHRSFPTSV